MLPVSFVLALEVTGASTAPAAVLAVNPLCAQVGTA